MAISEIIPVSRMTMAVESDAELNTRMMGIQPHLRKPFAGLSADALAEHFRSRDGITYFSVPDPEETQRRKIDAIVHDWFEFNGESHLLAEPLTWRFNPSSDLEWHILLHKFYYAVGLGLAYRDTSDTRYLNKWIALTKSWIEAVQFDYSINPQMASDSSQVTGRRIQNWIYAYYHFVEGSRRHEIPNDFLQLFLVSLHHQVDYLINNLSPALNHRTLELYAVFLAGVVFPEFRDAARWSEFALREIEKNVAVDLLPDGVHRELSTDYHHLVLKNYLCVRKLAILNNVAVAPEMDTALNRALEFSLYVHKPDGIVPSLSDGDARSFLDLLRQGHELYGRADMLYVATQGEAGRAPDNRSLGFTDSGYYILRSGWGAQHDSFTDQRYMVFDCGPLGAGNHGHLDLLSFELAAYGRSLVVDPGRYTYNEAGDVNWRVKFRGTGYHNTVLVDGKNQTRYLPVPGKARYKITGRAPQHALCNFASAPGFDWLHGVARSFEYDAVHERQIFFVAGAYWIVVDALSSQTVHDYDLLLHLSELAQDKTLVDSEGDTDTVVLRSPQLVIAQSPSPGVSIGIGDGFVSYRYGEKLAAPIVRFSQRAKNTVFHTVLYPYKDSAPRITLRELPVLEQPDASILPSALEISIEHAATFITDTCFFAPSAAQKLGRVWRFGDYQFDGDMLWLRKDAKGSIASLHTSEGATLKFAEQTLAATEVRRL